MTTTPKNYQLEGSRQIRAWRGRALLADEMGLGKTLQALWYVMKSKHVRPVVIVCPAFLKLNWERESAHHVGMVSEVLESRRPPKRPPMSTPPLLIINYEILGPWVPYLRALNPQCVIFDEIHYLKNRETKRYKASKKLVKGVKRVIGLSGTPLTNNPAELWSALHLIRPDLFDSYYEFAWKYTCPKKLPWGWQFSKAKNLKQLHRTLKKTLMIRRRKEDVLSELPRKVRQVLPVAIPMKEYREATSDFLGWLKKQDKGAAKRAKKSKALVKVGYLLRLVVRLKVPIIYQWIDDFLENSEGKLVVFTGHQRMIELLTERYHGLSVFVNGSVTGEDRQKAVDRFQKDPSIRLFIGNMKAAGVGITLTAASSVVFTDLPWNPADLTQCEDRIHRIGQTKTAFIYYLIARNTLEEKLAQVLHSKQLSLEGALDGKGQGDGLNIFNDLLQSLLP